MDRVAAWMCRSVLYHVVFK